MQMLMIDIFACVKAGHVDQIWLSGLLSGIGLWFCNFVSIRRPWDIASTSAYNGINKRAAYPDQYHDVDWYLRTNI